MPNDIKRLAHESWRQLDTTGNGILDDEDVALSKDGLAALDSDGDGQVTDAELASALERAGKTSAGAREIERAARRLAKTEEARERLGDTHPIGIDEARSAGVELPGQSSAEVIQQGLNRQVGIGEYERDQGVLKDRKERVERRRTKLAKSWEKIAKQAKTSPQTALAPKSSNKTR